MGKLHIPNAPQPIAAAPIVAQPTLLEKMTFSFKEKLQLTFIILIAIAVPVIATYSFTKVRYDTSAEFKTYTQQIEQLKQQLHVLEASAFDAQRLELIQLNKIIGDRLDNYNKEKAILTNNVVYIETIKKMNELDSEIIICHVHKNNIENSEKLNKEERNQLIQKIKKELYIQ